MNQSRVWTIGAVLLIVALIVGTWFLGVAPRLGDARDADAAREQAVAVNNIHRQTLSDLKADFDRIDEIILELEEARSVVPDVPEVSGYVASLHGTARQTGATVQELSVALPVAYQPAADAAGEYLAAANELAAAGMFVIDLTVEATGSQTALLNFISALQAEQRLVLVHDAQLMEEEGGYRASIRAQMFGLSAATVETADEDPAPAPVDQ